MRSWAELLGEPDAGPVEEIEPATFLHHAGFSEGGRQDGTQPVGIGDGIDIVVARPRRGEVRASVGDQLRRSVVRLAQLEPP